MTTPAHAIVNLVLLRATGAWRRTLAIVVGAIAPDLPMVAFYGYERILRGRPEGWIWRTAYWDPRWQTVFDLCHSMPIAATGFLLARVARAPSVALGFASMGLHALADLALHHDDAHRHFVPLATWRFASPVSYWDPRFFGHVVAPLEAVAVVAGAIHLARRFGRSTSRTIVLVVGAVYTAFLLHALLVWGPPR